MSRFMEIGEFLRDEARCYAMVWTRDTYRYTGRGKNGFQMHYHKRQCSRKKAVGNRCRQHAGASG